MRCLAPLAVLAAACVLRAQSFAVIGYVPDFHHGTLDWEATLARLTHLCIFSLVPTPDGRVDGRDRLKTVLVPLVRALEKLPEDLEPPKVLVTVGGVGRSEHFPKITGTKKARRQFARSLVEIFQEFPMLAGVDIDWQAPSTPSQWKELGKLAQEVKSSLTERPNAPGPPILTMTYHPKTGAVTAFGGIRGKKSETSFVDLFDFCHAMAYSHFDGDRRHSTPSMDRAAIEEWTGHGLPLSKMTLGVPLFGVNRNTGDTVAYREITQKEGSLIDEPYRDTTSDNVYFVNAASAAAKVKLAGHRGLGGVMLWELGQDRDVLDHSLVHEIYLAAEARRTLWNQILAKSPISEDNVMLTISFLCGLYLLKRTILFQPPGHALARKPRAAAEMAPEPSPAKSEES